MIVSFKFGKEELIAWLAKDLGLSGRSIIMESDEAVIECLKRLLQKAELSAWFGHLEIVAKIAVVRVTATGEGDEFEKLCRALASISSN